MLVTITEKQNQILKISVDTLHSHFKFKMWFVIQTTGDTKRFVLCKWRVNEAQWEDETVVSSSAQRVPSLIFRHGYCVSVKHCLRQLNTKISAGSTGIALSDPCPVQEGDFSSLRETVKSSQKD